MNFGAAFHWRKFVQFVWTFGRKVLSKFVPLKISGVTRRGVVGRAARARGDRFRGETSSKKYVVFILLVINNPISSFSFIYKSHSSSSSRSQKLGTRSLL